MAATFKSRVDRDRDSSSVALVAEPALHPFTVPSLLAVALLRDLAERVVDNRARVEEKERRKRVKLGKTTTLDHQLVARRKARGLKEGTYQLSSSERESKMRTLTEWAIRDAHIEGGVVQVSTAVTPAGYLPLPAALLAPLLVPVVSAARERAHGTFRSRLERSQAKEAASTGRSSNLPLNSLTIAARLKAWDGRWERVGQWAVEEALEWGEAQGILELER